MEKNKTAIITGAYGQDGSFMAELLSSKGYKVYGIVKSPLNIENMLWLTELVPFITILHADLTDKNDVVSIFKQVKPTEVYNFAGVSNVFDPYNELDYLFDNNARIPQNILQAIVEVDRSIKFFQASSCLIFGKDGMGIQNELTAPNPIYPYGITKLYADLLVKDFRDKYNLFCCSGIFFTHESERRGNGFFSKKIANAVVNIKANREQSVDVGNLMAFRDYGYAKDYVMASYMMLQNNIPTDYVIGTGNVISMYDFAKKCFEYVGLNCDNYLKVEEKLYRPIETFTLTADCRKIKNELGWEANHSVDDMIKIIIDNSIKTLKN